MQPTLTAALSPAMRHLANLTKSRLRRLAKLVACAFGLLQASPAAHAQCGQNWATGLDSSFVSYPDFPSKFERRNGDIIVWNAQGTLYTPSAALTGVNQFSPQTGQWTKIQFESQDFGAFAIAELPGDDLLVAGFFPDPDDYPDPVLTLRRRTPEGWTFVATIPCDSFVDFRPLANGDVVVFGSFCDVNGIQNTASIAKYSPATNTCSPFGTGFGAFQIVPDYVAAVAALDGGDVCAAGQFRFWNTDHYDIYGLAMFSALSDTWTVVPESRNYSMSQVVSVSGGDLILIGTAPNSSPPNGTTRCLRRSSQTGQLSELIPVFPGFSPTSYVMPFQSLATGEVLASLTLHNQYFPYETANYLVKYDPALDRWSKVSTRITGGFLYPAELHDGRILVAGDLHDNVFAGVETSHIMIFDPSLGEWGLLGKGLDRPPLALGLLPDGDVLVSGNFQFAGGREGKNLMRYSPESHQWSRFDPNNDSPYGITAILSMPNGDIIVGGDFYFRNAYDESFFGLGIIHPGDATVRPLYCPFLSDGPVEVRSIVQASTGEVVIAGFFNTYDNEGRILGSIVAYSPPTGIWNALGTGLDGPVYSVIPLDNGDIIVGGDFATAGGQPIAGLARYSFATASWSTVSGGLQNIYRPNPVVSHIFQLSTGELLIDGTITAAGGTPVGDTERAIYSPESDSWRVIPWNLYGQLESAANLPNGDLLVGVGDQGLQRYSLRTRSFTTFAGGTSSPIDSSPPAPYEMFPLPSGDLLLGGNFTVAGDQSSTYFAQYLYDGPHIIAQPQSVSVCAGNDATFEVAATAQGALTFKWMREGVVIDPSTNPSASTSTLTVRSAQPSDAGHFECLVSNGCDSAVSHSVFLSVSPAWDTVCGGPGCDADLNQDGVSDQGDVDYLINAIAGGGNPTNIDPDFNHDGVGDQGDIDALVNVIAGAQCP